MTYTYIDEAEAYQQYDDMLDECHPNQILDIPASTILKECDPIAYSCGFDEFLDGRELTIDETEAEDDEGSV
jgi:hypothetical protein